MKILHVNRTTRRLPATIFEQDIRGMSYWLSRHGPRRRTITALSIVFVPNAESQRLNEKFFQKHHPANVLSFRYDGAGEIIVAPAVVRREAGASRRPFMPHLRRMIVHGFLHLVGYHHEESPRQQRRFERLEADLVRGLRIK